MEESLGRALTPKALRTRERILEAALGLFAEKGYEATTMRGVAREAGASLGLAYRYFASKEEFALALYMRLAEESEEWARDGLAGGRWRSGSRQRCSPSWIRHPPIAVRWPPSSPARPQLPALVTRRRHRRGSREDGWRL